MTSSTITNAKVFLGAADSFSLSNSGATIYGSTGTEGVKIAAGVTDLHLDANIERVELAGNRADYQFVVVAGSGIQIQRAAGGVLATIPSLNNPTTLAFADGSAALLQTGTSAFTLGGLAVSTGVAASVAATLNSADKSTLATAIPDATKAKVFLGAGDSFTISNSGATVVGSSGNETLTLGAGVSGVKSDANIERFELAGNRTDYKFFAVAGSGIQIQTAAGVVVDTISSLNKAATIAFADASAVLAQTGGATFTLDGATVAAGSSGINIAGKVADGYIKGATVFADANGNGKFDSGEATTITDAKGNFTLSAAKGTLIASGGTDLSTNLAFKGVLKAVEGSTMINPLTTLQQGFVAKGYSVADAQATVFKALGIKIPDVTLSHGFALQGASTAAIDVNASKFDLATFDPVAAALDVNATAADRAMGAQFQAEATKVANFIVAAGQTLVGAAGGADKLDAASAGDALLGAMVNAISADADGVVSFSDKAMLSSIMNESVALSGDADLMAASSKVAGMADAFSAMSAAGADNVDKAVAAGGDITAMMINLVQSQVVAQGDMADKLEAAAAGGSLSDMQAGFTGAAFDGAANKATIGDLDPNSTTDDAAAAGSNTDAGTATDPAPVVDDGGWVPDAPTNAVPTITVPATPVAVTTGTASAALTGFTVADADASDTLSVTLTTTTGTINDLDDADSSADGIQLTGTAAEINTALASATFTATAAGDASINVSVTDGHVATPVMGTYDFTATAPAGLAITSETADIAVAFGNYEGNAATVVVDNMTISQLSEIDADKVAADGITGVLNLNAEIVAGQITALLGKQLASDDMNHVSLNDMTADQLTAIVAYNAHFDAIITDEKTVELTAAQVAGFHAINASGYGEYDPIADETPYIGGAGTLIVTDLQDTPGADFSNVNGDYEHPLSATATLTEDVTFTGNLNYAELHIDGTGGSRSLPL